MTPKIVMNEFFCVLFFFADNNTLCQELNILQIFRVRSVYKYAGWYC